MAKTIRAFTDGACSGNPGPGGWGAIILLDEKVVTIGGYDTDTTNNRMEIMSVISAINHIRDNYGRSTKIEIHSDSAYVVNAMKQGWMKSWAKNGWKNSKLEPVKNKDLWVQLEKIANGVTFIKVKGHDGNTFNEAADTEAVRQSTIAQEVLRKK